MGGFVLAVFVNCLKIPLHGWGVFFFQLVIYANIVIAWSVIWGNLCAFFVPFDSLIVHFLWTSINYPYFIRSSSIFRMQLGDLFKLFNFGISTFFISGKNEQRNPIVGLKREYFITNLERFNFFNSFVFVDICYALIRGDPVGPYLDGLPIVIYCFFIIAFVAQNVGQSERKSIVFRKPINIFPVPFDPIKHGVLFAF